MPVIVRPKPASGRCTRLTTAPSRSRRRSRCHPWRRPVNIPRPTWCHLCGTPLSCQAERIVFTFTEAEFARPAMRLAVHKQAQATGWSATEFRKELVDALVEAKVHFRSLTKRYSDLDLTPIESEQDGYEIDVEKEDDALRVWIEANLLEPVTEDTLPTFYGKGKARFLCIASALIGIYPELQERLADLADQEYPSPRE